MGPNVSKSKTVANSYNSSIQTSYNSTSYNSTEICNATCQNIQSNIYLVIENSSTGNISFNQACTAQLECVTENNLEFTNSTQLASSQLAEASAKTEKPPNFPPYIGAGDYSSTETVANSSNYSLQSAYNLVNTNLSKNCNSSSLNTQTDIFTVIKNSTTGDISFSQSGNATATCNSTNSAKISNYSSLTNSQTAKSEAVTSVKGLGGLFLIIVALVLIVAIIGIIKKQGGGGGGGSVGGGQQQIITQPTIPKLSPEQKQKLLEFEKQNPQYKQEIDKLLKQSLPDMPDLQNLTNQQPLPQNLTYQYKVST